MLPGARRRTSILAALLTAIALAASVAPAAAAPSAHGHLLSLVKARTELHATQSSNWFGYLQGVLEQGGKQFHAVSGEWTVPAVSAHVKGQSEASAYWVGIGGGCLDTSCATSDNTLIQVGTEHDVDGNGARSYSAWYELVPGPSATISSMTVSPGDRMEASVIETPTGSEMWTIQIKDLTRGESFSTKLPYPSSYATADWIAETPVVIDGGGAGIADLPNLSTEPFDFASADGTPVSLSPAEEIQLTDQNGNVIALPSTPDAESDGFGVCAWATTCSETSASAQPASSAAGSRGAPAFCRVPSLAGMQLARAKLALRRAHCALGRVRDRSRGGRARGTVLAERPKAGRKLRAGTHVELIVAR